MISTLWFENFYKIFLDFSSQKQKKKRPKNNLLHFLNFLKSKFQKLKKALEKSRGIGGRLISKRLVATADRATGLRADFGSQLWTITGKSSEKTKELLKFCMDNGLVEKFNGVIEGPNPYEGEDYVVKGNYFY